MNTKHFHFYLLASLIFAPLACSTPNPPQKTALSSAQEKFLTICREELKYPAYIIPNGKTMWVYIPLTDGVIDFRAAPKDQTPKAETKTSWSINNLESNFENKTFTINFDIGMTKKYDKPASYQNKYTDDYTKKQREILTALTRAYFDVGQRNINTPFTVGNEQTQKNNSQPVEEIKSNPFTPMGEKVPPEFFVMIFADTKRGVAVKAINYFEDMRMALSNPPAISNEEYIKRYVSEIYGDESMIGDKTGIRLKTSEITLGNFLAKQIENRIKYQFTQSGFPPMGEAQDEIWSIVAETLRLYQFKDFEKIKLLNLQTEKESTYDKSQL